jgi:hypothetical protein
MAKLTRPFWSLKAAGDFGQVLQYMCGHFVKAKPRKIEMRTSKQDVQRTKFSKGAKKWSKDLSPENREHWQEYQEFLSQLPECEAFSFGLFGYDLWMSYFLKYGEGGWPGYPDPPPP